MQTYKSIELLEQLARDVEQTIAQAQTLQRLDGSHLSSAPTGKWNVLQVLYHLNSYNSYYLPHIALAIAQGSNVPYSASFKPGLLGNYFVATMLPASNGRVKNAMKAPADHVAGAGYNDISAITTFIEGQENLLQLLRQARNVNMTRIKVPISISRFIKIRLGDTFRFLIAHQQRHFLQIKNTLSANGVALSV